MKKLTCIIIFILVSFKNMYPLVSVRGNETTAPFGFSQNILVSAFDGQTGSVFVGLEGGANEYSIARAVRPNFRNVSKFVPVAQNVLNNATIEFLSCIPTNQNTLLAAVEQSTSAFSASTVTILSSEGARFSTTESLNDASGTSTTNGILNIVRAPNRLVAENKIRSHVLAAVRPSAGNFGETNGGLALIEIDTSLLTKIETQIKDAQTGQDGNRAQNLDANSAVVTGGAGAVTFLGGTDENKVAMHYDETLDLFYIGIRVQTAADANAIGKAVVIAFIDEDGIVTLKEIVPNSAITTAPATQTHYIVAAQANAAQLKTFHVKTMHSSTNYNYLITNSLSSANNSEAATNEIYALPLVRNPGTIQHGMIAKIDPTIQNGPFKDAATVPADMVTSRDAAALVGGGPLPIETITEVQQIEVIDDTIFVGLGNSQDNLNNTGIFYSQAQFGPNGNIINWTQWAKRAVAIDTFPSLEDANARINFFHVDPVTGNIWIGENNTKQNVAITSWTDTDTTDTQESETKSLLVALNEQLQEGCFSALDLDSATRGFTDRETGAIITANRYALFGGHENIIFTRTGQANNGTLFIFPETIFTDYQNGDNFKLTSLAPGAGSITNLAYSKRDNVPFNYFFASSQHGLYVFAQNNGEGFDPATFAALDQAPFTTGRWTKVTQFNNPIIDIKSEGNALYVLTSGFTLENPFVDKLYVIPYVTQDALNLSTNISELFAPDKIFLIAQTGVGIFSDVTHFTEIAIIATDQDRTIQDSETLAGIQVDRREQLVLATTNGLFKTNANQTNTIDDDFFQGSADAQNQTEADWSLVTNTDGIPFLGISSTNSPIHHTVWPFSLQDPLRCNIFNAGSIHQVSGSENPTEINNTTPAQTGIIGDLVPRNFTTNGDIVSTDEAITDFWTDGGRRFFILNSLHNPSQQNTLGTFAFNISKFPQLPSPVITHPIVQKQKQFYWIQLIGRQGRLFAGTNNGIISLQ